MAVEQCSVCGHFVALRRGKKVLHDRATGTQRRRKDAIRTTRGTEMFPVPGTNSYVHACEGSGR